jgi:hypothetical protein
MMWALHGIIILGAAAFAYRRYGNNFSFLFWGAFVLRLTMGAALGLVYLHYYSANDTWLFFHDANALANVARQNFQSYLQFLFSDESDGMMDLLVNSQERSVFLIKIMSVFSLAGGNNYWISAAYFSLIAFAASWYLFSVVINLIPNAKAAAALAFLFFPSVLFWSSGLVKETLALAGLYVAAGWFLKICLEEKPGWKEWMLAIVGFYVAWNLKYYWAALFGAVIFTSLATYFLSKRFQHIQQAKLWVWLALFVLVALAASFFHPNFYVSRFLEVLITNHIDFVKISEPDGLIHFYNLQATWWSVAINAPWALFSGVLRPFIWEASGTMAFLASSENTLILLLLLASLRSLKRPEANGLLLLVVIVYVVLLCIFLAISTPNFGTLSRYRVGFLPFLVFIIGYQNPMVRWVMRKLSL